MNNKADIVIHINEELDHSHRNRLTEDVSHLGGVVSVMLHDERPHLMIVGYNTEKTDARDVLSGVQSNGMHAQLVGWL